MQFEAIGHLSQRFDVTLGKGCVALFATVRTRRSSSDDIENYAQKLGTMLSKIMQAKSPHVRVCVYQDQLCEECVLAVNTVAEPDEQTFATQALTTYLSLAEEDYAAPHIIAPTIVHEVCFLQTGHVVRYVGSGKAHTGGP